MTMMRMRTAIVVGAALAAGFACAALMPSAHEQGRSPELKRVDLGSWCDGKEAVISIEKIAPQHQSKHFHPAYSFAWMIEGSQVRDVAGQAPPIDHELACGRRSFVQRPLRTICRPTLSRPI